jgi:hypothetical protein
MDNKPTGISKRYINIKANSSEKGIVNATSSAIAGRPRNRIRINTTNVMPSETL